MSFSLGVLDVSLPPTIQHLYLFKYLGTAYLVTFVSHLTLCLRISDASEDPERSRVLVHLVEDGNVILRVGGGKHYTHSAKKTTICLEACITALWLFAEIIL